jgi:hypothetical protein
MKTYEVTLSTADANQHQGTWYILAPNSEQAAWSALELSKEKQATLINVRVSDEW